MHHVQGAIRRKLPSLILLFVLCALVLVFAPSSGGLAITAIACGLFALGLGVLAFLPLGAKPEVQHQQPVQPPSPGPAGQQGLSGPMQAGPPPGPPAAG
ncbi:hypothetical protein [Agrococcus jejuensis]|uniref:Uncharacterized protein n=1 Tax=Agrococcus jejuensis TaxID=399736 RepID=A0A1G8F7U5_9MICO|nr:hypothetical protein [Agrococcus jejuensis]SDH78170.1 hypothetical protein SAMN04489720_2369 [Agrococcus jejuensis]